jgi:hypothetical protein
MNPKSIPILVVTIHLILFVGVAAYTQLSSTGQAPLVWLFFGFLDFPISLAYPLIEYCQDYLAEVGAGSVLNWIFYPPYFVHGILGTAWWYVVARIISTWLYRRK